jgi:hypothetical protein
VLEKLSNNAAVRNFQQKGGKRECTTLFRFDVSNPQQVIVHYHLMSDHKELKPLNSPHPLLTMDYSELRAIVIFVTIAASTCFYGVKAVFT